MFIPVYWRKRSQEAQAGLGLFFEDITLYYKLGKQ